MKGNQLLKSIIINFEPTSTLILPLAKFEILQGLFYKLLSYNKELSAQIHNTEGLCGKYFKMFCFTDIQGRYHIQNKTIAYSGDLSWEIRAMNDAAIDTIADGLKEEKMFFIDKTQCIVTGIWEQSRAALMSGTSEVLMNTPITVYETSDDKFRKYYAPDDDRFYFAVENNLKNKYKALYGKECEERILFTRNAIAETKKCVTYYANSPITAYYGSFFLTGPAEIFDIAYYCGLGAKNSQGFGTIKKTVGGN